MPDADPAVRSPRRRRRILLAAVPVVAAAIAATVLTITLTGGGSLSPTDRAACDSGGIAGREAERAATGPVSLRDEHDELGRRAWDIALSAAAASDDGELRAMGGFFGAYDSPLFDSDLARLAEWCRDHGWEPREGAG